MIEPVKPFLGSRKNYNESSIIIFSVPLDATTTFRPGARFGPSSIRDASYVLEEHDYITGEDILDVPFHDLGELQLSGDLSTALNEIKEAADKILKDSKKPLALGGEHLITYPLIQAMIKKYSDLHVIVFDAHTDLRDEYLGLKTSHATVMRRVYDLLGPKRLYQFGVRSGSKEEKEFSQGRIIGSSFPGKNLLNQLKAKPVYLSIDIDVLEPASAPGTGTPEPCGWSTKELINSITALRGLNVIGADLVEVSPHHDPSGITAINAARAVRELLHLLHKTNY